MTHLLPHAVVVAIVAGVVVSVSAQQADRASVPEKYRWDLTKIYQDDAAWRAAKDTLVKELPAIEPFKGTLGSSAGRLAGVLELGSRLSKEFSRLYVYASMQSDQDTRVSTYQGMQQEMLQLGAQFGAATAFIEPEILKIEPATIDRFVAAEPRLANYRFYLADILRRRAHTLTDDEERLLASASVMADAPSSIFGILSNADFPYPSVTLSDGKTVRLDNAGFSLYRAVPEREGSREGDGHVLQRAGRLPGNARRDDEQPDPDRHLLRQSAQLRQRARAVARRPRTSRRRSTCGSSTASTATCRRSTAT